MNVLASVARIVVARARGRCEYCRMHQALQGATFHIEHIVPRSRGGKALTENLALACPACNLHKADRVTATDPDSGIVVPLFHPRIDDWHSHFFWKGHHLAASTSTARATVVALRMNDPNRLLIRQAEQMFDLFPPTHE